MKKVKIYGAGSVGNHLAHASRTLGWGVHLCDVDNSALERTKLHIYPSRYGEWDELIKLFNVKDAPRGIYDLIIIGTPPEFHLELALEALSEKPKAILIEKPLCTPDLSRAQEFYTIAKKSKVQVFVGYNHIVAWSTRKVEELIAINEIGNYETIDVEFREHWRGMFSAHPWLSGPRNTYLGFWRRGGGASGEHSHALNLWQYFAHLIGAERIVEVGAMLDYVNSDGVEYDKICALNLKTESGLIGRIIQDVVTAPAKKWTRIQARSGYVELSMGSDLDTVFYQKGNNEVKEYQFKKTRPDDFIVELKHINDMLDGVIHSSSISLECGLDTMLVLAAAHKSAREHRVVTIDYSKGYVEEALR